MDSVVIRRRFSSFVTKTVTGVSQGDEKKIINILRVMEIRAAEHKTPTCGLELGTLFSILSNSDRISQIRIVMNTLLYIITRGHITREDLSSLNLRVSASW